MSQYTNFFLRGEDKFYSLGDFSRSSPVAQIANEFLRYEEARDITRFLYDMENIAEKKTLEIKQRREGYQKRVDMIKNMKDGSSLSEKIEIIDEYESYMKELDDDLEAYVMAQNFFYLLTIVAEENSVWAGIECSEQPERLAEE